MTNNGHGTAGGCSRTLAIITAGVSEPSATAALATSLADATQSSLASRGLTVNLETFDLRPYAAELADVIVDGARPAQPRIPYAATPPAPAAYMLTDVVRSVTRADGLIAVTPIFAASYAGLFKSFFDVLDPASLIAMPVLLGATGGSARHSLAIEYAMRPLLNYFRARIVPTGVFAAAEDADDEVLAARLSARIDRAGRELADLMASLPTRSVSSDSSWPQRSENARYRNMGTSQR